MQREVLVTNAEILVAVPENLAHKARNYGLFNSQAFVTLLEAEVVRREQIAEDDEPPPWANMTNQELRERMDEAYADFPDEEEKAWLEFGLRQMRKFAEREKDE